MSEKTLRKLKRYPWFRWPHYDPVTKSERERKQSRRVPTGGN